MGSIVTDLTNPSPYRDRFFDGDEEEWLQAITNSSTLYVGNLSFYTTEEQIHELFSKCGGIKRIIMGLDKRKKTPCGFCFVEYYLRKDAINCIKYINGTKLDDRIVRTDLDPGFKDGRQFGRGRSGGQVRDEYRLTYDPGRGGWGPAMAEQPERVQAEMGEPAHHRPPKRRRDMDDVDD